MITVRVKFRNESIEETLSREATVLDLKNTIKIQKGVPVDQQRLEIANSQNKRIILENQKSLSEYSTFIEGNNMSLVLKNLGKQIEYANLFYLEYGFPAVSFIIFFLFNLGRVKMYHVLITALVVIHFGKRILETKYVHVFSVPSVPLSVLVRNCIYYWGIFGILVPIEVFVARRDPQLWSPLATTFLVLLFLAFEYLNFYCHWQLRNLRAVGTDDGQAVTTERKVTRGLFFDQIVSPNYTFEILAWITFSIIFRTLVGLTFTFLGFFIMRNWAFDKKKKMLSLPNLSAADRESVRRRYLIFPFIV